MSLSLTVLGCSGSYADADGACTGYLVDDGTTRLWLDCGPGTLANLQRHVAITDVDVVVVTHHHPDHWLELPVLRTALRHYLDVDGLPVLAPAATWAAARSLMGEVEPTFAPVVVATGEQHDVGSLTVRFARTDHPVETLAVRIDGGGRSLAFTADTGPAFTLAPLGEGIDAVLAEATLDDAPAEHVHIGAAQAGTLAAEAGAGRLLLTHLPPGADAGRRLADAATTFDGPITSVTTHERYDL